MTATDVASIATVLTGVGALSFLLLVVCARVISSREAGRERVAKSPPRRRPLGSAAPFIEMPPHLKTRQEMVDWMQHDLPRQTAGLIMSDREY
jgi:hypothetical protein